MSAPIDYSVLSWLALLPTPVWITGPGGVLVACNTAYAALFACDPGAAVDRQKILGTVDQGTVRQTVDGQRRLLCVQYGGVAGDHTIWTAIDQTAEEELRAENSRLQTGTRELLSHLSTALARFDVNQKLEFYNTGFAQLWGLDEAWLSSKPKLGDVLERLREARRLPEQVDFKRYKQSWLDMFTTLIEPFDDMMHLPDGKALRLLVVPNPTGGLMYLFEDVSSRLELETSYNTLVAVQRETLDHLQEAIAVFAGDGRLKLSNPAFRYMWALHPEDIAGEPHITELAARLRTRFRDGRADEGQGILLAQVLGGADMAGQLELTDDRLVAFRTVVLPDSGVLVSYDDVTDQVRVEMALRDKNAALEAAERLKLDFLANVSYQLRTPLNAIMGFTEILDREFFGPLNEKQKQYTAGTHEASQKLLGLIDDILDLSTIEAGYMKLDLDQIDVDALIKGVQTLTLEWARKEGLEVMVDLRGDLGVVVVDPRRLKQVLVNLIRNAIAYSPVGGVITIGAERQGEDLHLWVKDQGTGIAPQDQARVLEPFERGMTAASPGRSGGAGLGLTLVKNITELHGGHVTINSQVGGGTTVNLTMPLFRTGTS